MEKNIEIICKALSSKKSVLIRVLNVRGLTSIADDFILATTRNKKQAQAAADEVEEKAAEIGLRPPSPGGIPGRRLGSPGFRRYYCSHFHR